MQGKEDIGGPEESLVWPHSFSAGQGPPTGHREGSLTRWSTFGPMEPPFPGRHGQGVQDFSLLLKTRKRTQSGRDFLKVMALPVHHLEEGGPQPLHFPRPT